MASSSVRSIGCAETSPDATLPWKLEGPAWAAVGATGTVCAPKRMGANPEIKPTNRNATPGQTKRAQQQLAFFSEGPDGINDFLA